MSNSSKKGIVGNRFGRKGRSVSGGNNTRKLGMESLEDRCLLAAWGGFETPVDNVYSSTEVIGNDAVYIDLADINGDGYNDLVVVNKSDSTKGLVSVYWNNESGGFVSTPVTTTFSSSVVKFNDTEAGVGVFLYDVNGDETKDLVVVSQTEGVNIPTLTLKVFYGATSGSFHTAADKTQTLNIRDATGITVTDLMYLTKVLPVVDSTGNLVVQVSGFHQKTGYQNFDNYTSIYRATTGTTGVTWDSQGERVTPISGKVDRNLFTTVELNGISGMTSADEGDYYVTYDSNSTLYFSHDAGNSTWKTWTLNFGNTVSWSTVSLYWALSQGTNMLVCGANNSMTSYGLLSLEIAQMTQSGASYTMTARYDWADSPEVIISTKKISVCGSLGRGNDYPSVIFATNGRTAYFDGAPGTSEQPSCRFGYRTAGRSTPAYVASTATKLMNGVSVILAVGSDAVWGITNPSQTDVMEFKFSSLVGVGTIREAVFGDFNGDGYIDLAVRHGESGTAVGLYLQSMDGERIVFNRVISPEIEGGTVVSMVTGNFVAETGDAPQRDELALLVSHKSTETVVSYNVYVYNSDSVSHLLKTAASMASCVSISAGDLDGDGVDEIQVGRVELASGSETTGGARLVTLKRNGSALTVGSTLTVTTSGTTLNDTITAVAGDINGDEKPDLMILVSSTTNASSLSYAFQNTDSTFASVTVLDSNFTGQYLSGIIYEYIDSDSYKDIVITSRASNGTGTRILTYRGTGTTGWFQTRNTSPVDSKITTTYYPSAVSCAKLFDAANDLVITLGTTIAIWENTAKSSGSVGVADLLFQNYNSYTPNTTLADAQDAARTWLDEWSNTYLEVWATTEGAGDITTFSVTLAYNTGFFVVGSQDTLISGTGVTVNTYVPDASQQTITITGTAENLGGSTSSVRLFSLRFSPKGGVGVPVPANGEFQSAQEMGYITFAAETANIVLNGLAVAEMGTSSTPIADVPVYPVTLDFTDDGIVNTNDIADVGMVYEYTREQIKIKQGAKYTLLDFRYNGIVNNDDIADLGLVYGYKAEDGRDDIYSFFGGPDAFKPKPVSAALPEVLLAVAEEVDPVTNLDVTTLASSAIQSSSLPSAVQAALPLETSAPSRSRTAILDLLDEGDEVPLLDTSEIDAFLTRGFVEEADNVEVEETVLM